MKRALIMFLFSQFCFLNASIAQSDEILIKSLLTTAQQDNNDQQFRSALRNIEKAKNLYGGFTPKMHYLSMKAYIGLKYYDDARKEIKSYFDLAKEDDPHYNEMVLMITKIEDIEVSKEGDKNEFSLKRENELEEWEKAQKTNTIDSYKTFINSFPKSEYVENANQNTKYLIQSLLDKDVILEQKYYKSYRSRKIAKNAWKGFGWILLGSGVLVGLITEIQYPDDLNFVGFSAIGAGASLPFFIVGASLPIKKRKQLYEDQSQKVNKMRQSLSFSPTLLNSVNSPGLVYRPGLNIKYSF